MYRVQYFLLYSEYTLLQRISKVLNGFAEFSFERCQHARVLNNRHVDFDIDDLLNK